jgi:hypothetical protein
MAAGFVWSKALPYAGLVLALAWLIVSLKPVAFALMTRL